MNSEREPGTRTPNPEPQNAEQGRVRYSPERRTAVVLCGSGAHGAYHAGALRALQEAGVKVDVVAGQGVGGAAAALAAIDGAARLWDADGIWRTTSAHAFYGWRWPVRAAMWLALLVVATLAAGTVAAAPGDPEARRGWFAAALLLIAALACVVSVGTWLVERRMPSRRRRGGWWWRMLGAPIEANRARAAFARAIWHLIRGAAHLATPAGSAIGRRYAEILAENLGQPGFHELMLIATDLDARCDVVAALLREPYRRDFTAPRTDRERPSEVVDLVGTGRDHAFDFVAAALTPPVICDPYLISFGVDSYWRGETHRLCDRPGAVIRLLEELAAVGVSQAIVVSAVPTSPPPHRLTALRLELRHRMADFLAAAELAALRDALEATRLRFDSVYVISPAHNPIGVFDLAGAYDEASDRRQDLFELMSRAYEDAYRQFIEPVVGASGEHLARIESHRADLLQ